MKNLYILFFLFLLVSQAASSQNWSYVNTDEYFADANDVIEDADGNILVCGGGGSWPFTSGGDVRITKLDASGNLLWEYEFTSPATIGAITANDIAVADGGYVVFCSGYEKPLIIKLSSAGSLEWTSESWCSSLAGASLSKAYGMVASDGSITMAGQDGFYTTFNIYKVAADGSLVDELSHSMGSFFGWNIIETWEGIGTSDDGLAVCGGIYVGGVFCPFVWKFDSDGNEEWRSDLTDYEGNDGYGITQTSDGGYAVAAANPFGPQSTLIKTDNSGVASWGVSYAATSASHIPYAADVAERTDGTYALAVNNYDNTATYFGFADVIFTDGSGAETSRITVAGGEETTQITSINAMSDGGFAFCGSFGMDDYMAGAWDSRYYAQRSGSDGSLPACIYNCVWPGDADNSGTANTDDILAIGLGSGSTGAARTDMSTGWYAHAADAWATTLPDGTNHKYTDCNGDGTINDDDTAAVSANYSNEHVVVSLKTEAGEIPLTTIIPVEGLVIGYNELPIHLGDAINSIDAIYGLRFTTQIECEDVDGASIKVKFNDSWFGNASDNLQFNKNFADDKNADAALVRKDLMNAEGNGEIGTLSFVLVDNIAGKTETELTINFNDIRAIDVDMNDLDVYGVSATTTVVAIQNESLDNIITIYPNPATEDYITFDSQAVNIVSAISMYDLTGKLLKEFSNTEIQSGKLLVGGFANGTYQLKIKT
ncbi:MAG: T9SS type A sorting domain-containing protein, partial [Fimbriimonadaceae bacterium]|nr:T9SS type A sorting domain-containing protein [Chitinophagales bacterium]